LPFVHPFPCYNFLTGAVARMLCVPMRYARIG
jgi:hypothetical protein